MNSVDTSLEELNQWMLAHHMHGYWMQEGGGPGTQFKPYLWKWADIAAGLTKAGALVPVGPSGLTEMRTIGLRNPEQRGVPGSISLSPQILMPGERTRAHHNLKNETRFVIQAPPGAVFVADGEAFPMQAGDLVVSPTGSDHDHYNGGTEPAIWLDGLDMGLLNLLGAEINERYPVDDPYQAIDKPTGYFSGTQVQMKAAGVDAAIRRPPVRYPWADTVATLTALKQSETGGDPYDGLHLRYTSPTDGGPTLPSFSCEIQLLTSGLRTRAHRHNSTAIYAVVRGEGRTEVAEERLEWAQGDIFCVPPWTWHRHENPSHEDAILYSIDDWPAMAKMGFYRRESEGDMLR
jgi:1-hydroxy-2-naphthoate dioxygenase